jgi:hypothetical protein
MMIAFAVPPASMAARRAQLAGNVTTVSQKLSMDFTTSMNRLKSTGFLT